MSENNPYQSPRTELLPPAATPGRAGEVHLPAVPDRTPAISTAGTIVPRHIAAGIDNTAALIASLMAANAVGEERPLVQAVVLVAVYVGYFLFFEAVLSRTPGKLLTGLSVVQLDGSPCTLGQALVRTGFRLLEVNPLLLGAIPAALSVIASRYHQRIGDRIAGTIVVPTR